ncbi:MAG TPA: cyclic nucleotide-binding domain-containing protein [Candidatus Limnocylindrales bacterium]|nr:cyclic nucleotide-binding domain-containing protein [Candidatus Limnocylindrales bacterium]
MPDKLDVLRSVPLFADLDERSLQAVAILAREARFPAGTQLMLEGEIGDGFYVILDGTVRIDRGERTIRSMTAGGFLGEIALLEKKPRTATATAVSDVTALELQHHELERLLDTMPAIRTRVAGAIARRERGDATT